MRKQQRLCVAVLGLAVVGLVLATANTSQAGVISYSTRTAFDAAFPGAMIENWDSFPNGTVFPNGSTVNGITYNSSDGNALVTSSFLTSTPPNGLGETANGFFLSTDTITFTFSHPLSAFGIDINTFATVNGSYMATTNTGDIAASFFDPFPAQATGQFLGFSDTTPFTSVTFSTTALAGGQPSTLDTLRDQAAIPVPEPSSLALLSLGGLGLAGWRRWKKRATA
jgi:PEP-CTERM motif